MLPPETMTELPLTTMRHTVESLPLAWMHMNQCDCGCGWKRGTLQRRWNCGEPLR